MAGQVFNLGDQTKVVKTNDKAGEYAEQNLKDTALAAPQTTVGLGSASGTLSAIKELLSSAALAELRSAGDTDALSKLTEFAEEVILTPDNLESDLVNQQKNATIFNGKLWDALRTMAKASNSGDLSEAVLDFAKAVANNAAKDEILTSLSANFKYLAREAAPSKAVSEELMKASESLLGPDAPRNYQALKSTLVRLVNYTNESLLLDDKTQNLLPLIIHNMSRYSDDPTALRKSFDTLLNIFDSVNFNENALKELARIAAGPKESRTETSDTGTTSKNTENTSGLPQANPAEKAEGIPLNRNNEAYENSPVNGKGQPVNADTRESEALPQNGDVSQSKASSQEGARRENVLILDGEKTLGDALAMRKGSTETSPPEEQRAFSMKPAVSFEGVTPEEIDAMTPQQARQMVRSSLEKLFDDFILSSDLPADVKASSVINSKAVTEQNNMENITGLLAIGIKSMAARLDTVRLKDVLSGIDPHNGSASIKLVLASVTPNTPAMAEALDTIIGHYDKTGDLSSLINRLETILNAIDDPEKKIPLAHMLNETLSELAMDENSNYSPPTSLDTLADFLVKNINDTALQSLTAMNRGDMVRNMLTNPGAFNPLMHFFVPLDAFGMRAFAEVWVDKNDESAPKVKGQNGIEDTNHIFMCFDMENVGYFEMEMFARGQNLSVMLLCPEGTEKTFAPLKGAIPRIAAASGYSTGAAIIDTLYRRRDLDAVFPELKKRRGNLDAKA